MPESISYKEIGEIDLDIKGIANLSYLDRLCRSAKIPSVDIFIEEGAEQKVTIVAQDLSSNMTAIARTNSESIDYQPKLFDSNISISEDDELDSLEDLNWGGLEDIDLREEGIDMKIMAVDNAKDYVVYRFSTSSNIVTTLTLFNKVKLYLEESKITIRDSTTATEVEFDRRVTLARLELFDDMLENMEWEKFPLDKVRHIAPLLDKIESSAFKQHLILKDDDMYSTNNAMVLETKLGTTLKYPYLINYNMLRVLKYSPKKIEDPYISRYKGKFVSVKLDNVIVVWDVQQEILPSLMALLKDYEEVPAFKVTKELIEKIKLVASFGKENNLRMRTFKDGIELQGVNIKTKVPLKTREGLFIEVDFDVFDTAIKLADAKEPVISIYNVGDTHILMSTGSNKAIVRVERFKFLKGD